VHKRINYYPVIVFLCSQLLLSGCTMVYKSTGDIMIDYAQDEGVPYMLATDDVALGCSMAEAFTPFFLSFSRVTTPPDQLAILFYLVAGSCMESKAWAEELRYLRAVYAKKSIAAQDARIAQQRFLIQAARRQLTGYHYLTAAMTEPGAECPEFAADNDEFYWLLGLLNGIQAIMNDIATGGSVEVPMDIAAKVGRGAACLDSEKWWGTPDAIQAAIWITIPGNLPAGKDPLQVLQQSLQIGMQQGMSVTQVLAVQVYLGQGDMEAVKQIIRSHAGMAQQTPANQQYKMLNEVSKLQIQAISDRLWTAATGKRTPLGRIGSFWDDPDKAVETIDIDAIL
jgi:hypothetical protein